jgi:hypothetical protein
MQARLGMPCEGATPARTSEAPAPHANNLYEFWGDTLARSLARDFDLVVNVASVEYSKAVTPHLPQMGVPVLTCLFGSAGDLLLQLLEERVQYLLCLLIADLGLLMGQYIFDAGCEVLIVQFLYAAAHEVLTH